MQLIGRVLEPHPARQDAIGAPISAVLRQRPMSRIAIRGWIGMVEAVSIEWLANPQLERGAVRDLLVDMLFDLLLRVLDPKDAAKFKAAK